MKLPERGAFSLVEVALALGVMAFVLLSLLALLPLGLRSNQESAEETHATSILSALVADLQNTHPAAASGKSLLYGLQLPYEIEPVTGAYRFNPAITAPTTTLRPGVETVGIDNSDRPVAIVAGQPIPFQANVIYTSVPGADSQESMCARLVVNWPAVPPGALTDVTDLKKVRGIVEAVVAFPAP